MEVYNYSRWINSNDTYSLKEKVTAAIFQSGLGMIGQQDSSTFGIWISEGGHTALHTIGDLTYIEMTAFDESVVSKFKSIVELI
jgi:hypothetical protein